MQRCLELAALASGRVAPNPMVGSVLVHEGEIIGEGYHEYYGGPHAEVNCINCVSVANRPLIEHATLYVSLEPCDHFGKTPPCTHLIIEHKIPEVRIGCIDQHALVSGRGVARLTEAGVNVATGILEKECIELNKRFFTSKMLGRPYIILKWAQSVNGVMGSSGQRLHISNEYTNILVQQWRSEEESILVGHTTAVSDDPLLTNRYDSGGTPLRIILCRKNIPRDLKMFSQPGRTVIFNTEEEGVLGGVQLIKVAGEEYLSGVLQKLQSMNIQSVLVEGGAYVLHHFFQQGVWDECRVITNKNLFTQGDVYAPRLPDMILQGSASMMGNNIDYFIHPDNKFVARNSLSGYF